MAFLECNRKQSCLTKHYNRYMDKYSSGNCAQHYEGIMCSECEKNYGKVLN